MPLAAKRGLGLFSFLYSSAVPEEKNDAVPDTRAVVNKILQNLEKKLSEDMTLKGTLGEYIRLIQLQKEMGEEEPSEITVIWVDEPSDKK
jgi:hypothetical protein